MGQELAQRVRRAWEEALAGLPGSWSLALRTPTEMVALHRADVAHYAASTIKLAVLAALLRDRAAGLLGEGESVVVHADFPSVVGGRFTLHPLDDQDDETWARLGTTAPLLWLAGRMTSASGNLATALVAERLGFARVRHTLAAAGLDVALRFDRLIGDAAAQAADVTNTVTATGLASLLAQLADGPLLAPADRALALGLLAAQEHRRMIPAGLPDGTWSASKGGWVPGVKHDVALVRPAGAPPYVLAVCSTADLPDPDGERLVARLSALTWEAWTTWHR